MPRPDPSGSDRATGRKYDLDLSLWTYAISTVGPMVAVMPVIKLGIMIDGYDTRSPSSLCPLSPSGRRADGRPWDRPSSPSCSQRRGRLVPPRWGRALIALGLLGSLACELPGNASDSDDPNEPGDSSDPGTSGGSASSSDSTTDPGGTDPGDTDPGPTEPDFSAIDARLEGFVSDHPAFDGASMVIVDKVEGTIHQAAFGDHTLDTIVMLASVSKVPSASLLMALAEDDDLGFEIDVPSETYLPWTGVWPGVTAEQMVSNTSGLPGLQYFEDYEDHTCQRLPEGHLQQCGQTIYQTPLDHLPSSEPGVAFDYGGSQWQLAGALAEVVGGASWAELFDEYIAAPCELEVFEYGNMWSALGDWAGSPDSLVGRDNPNIGGGAISNLDDYAKLLMMHLNEGRCGDTQVLSADATAFMRIDRGSSTGSREGLFGLGYGMGWWVVPRDESEPYLYIDPGAFGSISWMDTDRDYAGYVAFEDYTQQFAVEGIGVVFTEIIPLVEAALDASS